MEAGLIYKELGAGSACKLLTEQELYQE